MGLISTVLSKGWVRKGLEEILVSGWFSGIGWDDGAIVTPCSETEDGAPS